MELDIEDGAEATGVENSAVFGSFMVHVLNTLSAIGIIAISSVTFFNLGKPICAGTIYFFYHSIQFNINFNRWCGFWSGVVYASKHKRDKNSQTSHLCLLLSE